MGRYRGRSRSYSPRRSRTPPPPPPRRRYDDPRDRRSQRDRRSPAPSGLLIRNISLDARPEDLRTPFERFGPVKDVYLPKNYYTGEPRGFGFVKFRNAEDAAEAKHHLNHTVIGGREIAIVFAAENRKTPLEMRKTGRTSSRYGGSNRRRSPPRSPRRRYHSYSRSASPARRDSSDRDHRARDYYSPSRSRSISRSASPHDDRVYRSSRRSTSPRRNGRSPLAKRERGSDLRSASPRDNDRNHLADDHSPHDKRDPGFDYRSPIAREDDQSLSKRDNDRSHRGDDHSPNDKRDPGFDRRSPVAREDDRILSRSRSRPRYHSRSPSYSPR